MDSPERTWPNREIAKTPVWYSVDLRDGNQALVEPMVVEEKVEMLDLLVKLGFKKIEVGFPAASWIEYDFLRALVEHKLIPDDVKVQVLVQCREHLIKRTFETFEDVKKVIVHIHNPTSTLRKDMVFHKGREDIGNTAVIGTKMVRRYVADCDTQIRLEYPPESFTGTELDSTLNICIAVQEAWGATRESPIIINPPSVAEVTAPNVYAGQVEWVSTHFRSRENIILNIHPYNDRGEGVASAELALLAGAGRVEGTLLGNGERTGNMGILTVTYNTFSQGISPELNIEGIREIANTHGRYTETDIPPRHPYAGKLVFTTFSGSYQDAINKGMQALHERNGQHQEVPCPPIDPSDIGGEYEPVVRINGQSGKSGVAFAIDTFYGFKLLKGMHKEFVDVIRKISEQQGRIALEQIMEEFKKNYLERKEPIHFRKCRITDAETGNDEFATLVEVTCPDHGIKKIFGSVGNGPIAVVQGGMEDALGIQTKVPDHSKYALASDSGTEAASYIHLVNQVAGKAIYGVGISSNITKTSLRGTFGMVSRLFYQLATDTRYVISGVKVLH